jgi:light-regulated signal transduction histidine kinase (bacteriophytochrome)
MFSTHYKMPHRPSDRELRFLDLLARQAADFIEQAQLRESLATRAAELEDANRELEAFNYTAAHDLRQPLNNISSFSQAVGMICGELLNEDCKNYLQSINDVIKRMSGLIESLLRFSRLSRVELQKAEVDLSAMAKAVAGELRLSEPDRGDVTVQIADGVTAYGDSDLLRIVLNNLLGNAWKYTSQRPDGSLIEFGVSAVEGGPAFFVRDNGQGFNMADAEKLFVPFQRLPGVEGYRGFGIGLATVERIIRRHGGKVWAEGELGAGATFLFTIPSS